MVTVMTSRTIIALAVVSVGACGIVPVPAEAQGHGSGHAARLADVTLRSTLTLRQPATSLRGGTRCRSYMDGYYVRSDLLVQALEKLIHEIGRAWADRTSSLTRGSEDDGASKQGRCQDVLMHNVSSLSGPASFDLTASLRLGLATDVIQQNRLCPIILENYCLPSPVDRDFCGQ